MLKKFEKNDIFINKIKTHPKISIFTYSGSLYYNKSVVPGDGIKIFDFLKEPISTPPDCAILAQNGYYLLAQDNSYLIIDNCSDDSNTLTTEDSVTLITEDNLNLLTE